MDDREISNNFEQIQTKLDLILEEMGYNFDKQEWNEETQPENKKITPKNPEE